MAVEKLTPFDGELAPGLDIPGLWEAADRYSNLSPRKDMRRSGSLLLREHLRGNFPEMADQEELSAMLDRAALHFKQLQRFGMNVITHATVANPEPWPVEDDQDEEDVIAYGASAYVPNLKPLQNPRTYMPLTSIPKLKVEEFVLEPLHRYIRWGIAFEEPGLLNDIFTPDQYSWHPHSGLVALHDTGPQISPTEGVASAVAEDLEVDFMYVGI